MNRVGVHETAFIASDVKIGLGTVVGPNSVILGPCTIGKNCWIGPNVVIGTPAEDFSTLDQFNNSDPNIWNLKQGFGIFIGDNVIIREHVAIHQGVARKTTINDNVFLMHGSHVGHDVYIDKNVTISPLTAIGGYCKIFENANLGMSSVIHQKLNMGAYSMIGMNSTVTKNINPFELYYGSPAKKHGLNIRLMKKMNYSDSQIENLISYYEENKNIPDFVVKYINQMKDI